MPTMFDKLVSFLKSQPDSAVPAAEVARVAVTKSIEAQVDEVLADDSLSPDEQVEKAEAIIKSYEDATGDTESFGDSWIAEQVEKADEDDDETVDEGEGAESLDDDEGGGEGEGEADSEADSDAVGKCGCGKANCPECKGKKGNRTSTKKEDTMDAKIQKELEDKVVALQKSLETQTEVVNKMREDKALAEARAQIGKMLGLIPGNVDVLATAIRKMDGSELAELEKVLNAANEQAKIAGLTVEKGASSDTSGDPLEVAVSTIRKADPTLSEAQATEKALAANPKLYATTK